MELNNTGKLLKQSYEMIMGLIGFFYIILFWSSPMCDVKSKQYRYAHSLSQERLEKIYLDLRGYAEQKKYFKRVSRKITVKPKEFEDLEYMRLILTERSLMNDYATVRLNACMDSTIDIVVEGLKSEKPVVKLIWGEFYDREEILWKK